MLNKNIIRLLLFVAVGALHVILLLLLAFNVQTLVQEKPENARVMKVIDLDEAPPPPPPPPPEKESLPEVEAIAEEMIETETEPEQIVVEHGTIDTPQVVIAPPSFDDYLPIHKVSEPPKFDEREIAASLIYPPIAQRSGIEGNVILELFVDRNGLIQQVRILKEDPKDRGFGEAAVKAFSGKQGRPARANGEAVSARYRYPVRFKIK